MMRSPATFQLILRRPRMIQSKLRLQHWRRYWETAFWPAKKWLPYLFNS